MASNIDAQISVAFEEMAGSPTEGFTQDGFQAERVVKCVWEDRFKLAKEFLGGPIDTGASIIEDFVVQRGLKYRDFPAATVTDVGIQPLFSGESRTDTTDPQSRFHKYKNAQLTVTYSTAIPSDGGEQNADEFVTESIESNVEFLTGPEQNTLSNTSPGFTGSEKSILNQNPPPTKLIVGYDWVYTRHRLRTIPNDFSIQLGRVNNAKVTATSTGLVYDEGQLLYASLNLTRTIDVLGALDWRSTQRFSFRESTWNKFWDFSSSSFVFYLNAVGVQIVPYPGTDFKKLLAST